MKMLSRWRYGLMAGLVVVTAIVLTACNPMHFRTAAAQVSQIVARCPSSPKTFNYAFLSSYPNIFGFTFEALLGESKTGKLEPGLAESWILSDDKLHITFTLRQGLKWSDGHPLTIEDVLFSFNDVYLNEKIPTDIRDSLKIGQSGALPKVRRLNEHQIEFTLPEPFAPFLRGIRDSMILPAHVLRPTVFEKDKDGKPKFISTWGTDTAPREIVVNGPYRLTSYVPSQRLVFERNPYYWRKDTQGKQLPYIDRIVWQIIESSDTALLQFRSQGLDMLTIGPGSFSLLKRQEKPGNYTIYEAGPDSGTTFIGFNLNQGQRNGKPLVDPIKSRWFNTKEFRQAIAYALDRQTMINNIYRGLGKPQHSPISVQSPYYRSPKEGLKTYEYNPDKAKRLLQSIGFKYNPQGQLLDAEGHRVRFTLSSNSGSRLFEAVLSQVKQNLDQIGIQLDLQLIDFSILIDKLSNSLDLEMYALGFSGGVEPNAGSNLWMPNGGSHLFNQKPQKGQAPISGQKVADWEAKIGQLFIQSANELDETKRKALYGEMQQIAQEEVPLIYLVNPLVMAAIRNRVQGVQLSPLFYEVSLWNAYELKTAD